MDQQLKQAEIVLESLINLSIVVESIEPEEFDESTAVMVNETIKQVVSIGGGEVASIANEALGFTKSVALESIGEWLKNTAKAGIEAIRRLLAKIRALISEFLAWVKSKFATKPKLDPSKIKTGTAKPSADTAAAEPAATGGNKQTPTTKPAELGFNKLKLHKLTGLLLVSHPDNTLKQHIAYCKSLMGAHRENYVAAVATIKKVCSEGKSTKDTGGLISDALDAPFKLAIAFNGHPASQGREVLDKSLIGHVLKVSTFKSTALKDIEPSFYSIEQAEKSVEIDGAEFESTDQVKHLAGLCNELFDALLDFNSGKVEANESIGQEVEKFLNDFTAKVEGSAMAERNKAIVMKNAIKYFNITTSLTDPNTMLLKGWKYLSALHNAVYDDLVKAGVSKVS